MKIYDLRSGDKSAPDLWVGIPRKLSDQGVISRADLYPVASSTAAWEALREIRLETGRAGFVVRGDLADLCARRFVRAAHLRDLPMVLE